MQSYLTQNPEDLPVKNAVSTKNKKKPANAAGSIIFQG
jgi:hypothetical protein